MRARFRRWAGSLVLLLGLVAGSFWATGPVLTRSSRQVGERLVAATVDSSLEIESVRFERARVDLRHGVVYEGLEARLLVSGDSGPTGNRRVLVQIEKAVVRPVGVMPLKVALDLDGISAVASPVVEANGKRLAPAEFLNSGRGRIFLSGALQRPVAWLRTAIGDFLKQALQGALPEGSRLRGQVEFSVDSRWHTALFYTLVSKEGTRLVLRREDVALIGAEYDQPLTEGEIDLVSLYPLRAPVLLRIKQYAALESSRLSRSEWNLPRDAYRHVLWSYLLTREFGAVFAERVTDAHEIGATYESGLANREMDLVNNAVGRRYAELNLDEADLPGRFLSDPAVARAPSVSR